MSTRAHVAQWVR